MPIQNVSTFSDHNAELESINRQRQLAMMLQNNMMDGLFGLGGGSARAGWWVLGGMMRRR